MSGLLLEVGVEHGVVNVFDMVLKRGVRDLTVIVVAELRVFHFQTRGESVFGEGFADGREVAGFLAAEETALDEREGVRVGVCSRGD